MNPLYYRTESSGFSTQIVMLSWIVYEYNLPALTSDGLQLLAGGEVLLIGTSISGAGDINDARLLKDRSLCIWTVYQDL